MTDAELRDHIKAALHDELAAVVEREREASDRHRVAEVKTEREARERRERRETMLMRYVIAPLVVAAVGGGGLGVYQNMQTPENVTEAVDVRVDALETVIKGCPDGEQCSSDAKEESLTGRVDAVEKRTQRLGDLHMSQRELVIDVRDELADKLDAVSPRAAETEPRESINKARRQVEAHKVRKAAKEAEAALEEGDPFAGLDD